MHIFKLFVLLPVVIFNFSCSNPDKFKEELRATNDSLEAVDSIDRIEGLPENKHTPTQLEITALLTEGTYNDGELPFSPESENWYALIGKEGGISEVIKVELHEARYEPSEGEDYAPNTHFTTIPTMVNPVILFSVQGSMSAGEIKGRIETRFIEPESTYELVIPNFFLRAEGTSTTNEQDETSYEGYGLMLEQGERVQRLYSDLSFSSKTPSLIWSGDLNADGMPDLLFETSVDQSDIEAHYELWLSYPSDDEFVKLVAEHKIYPGA